MLSFSIKACLSTYNEKQLNPYQNSIHPMLSGEHIHTVYPPGAVPSRVSCTTFSIVKKQKQKQRGRSVWQNYTKHGNEAKPLQHMTGTIIIDKILRSGLGDDVIDGKQLYYSAETETK